MIGDMENLGLHILELSGLWANLSISQRCTEGNRIGGGELDVGCRKGMGLSAF